VREYVFCVHSLFSCLCFYQYSVRDPFLEEKLAPLNALTWPEVARQTLVAFLLARTHAALAVTGNAHSGNSNDHDGPSQSSAVVAATSVVTASGSVRLALTGPRAKHGPVSGPSRDKATLNLASLRLLARYEPSGTVNHPAILNHPPSSSSDVDGGAGHTEHVTKDDENGVGGSTTSSSTSSSSKTSSDILVRRTAAEKWLQEGFDLLAHSRTGGGGDSAGSSTPALVPSSNESTSAAHTLAGVKSAPVAAVSMQEDSVLPPVPSPDGNDEASTITSPPVDVLLSKNSDESDQASEAKTEGNEEGNADEEEEDEDEEDESEDEDDAGSGDGSRADSGWVSRRLQKIADDDSEPYVRRAIAKVMRRLLTTRAAQPLVKFQAPVLAQALCEDLGATSSFAAVAAAEEVDGGDADADGDEAGGGLSSSGGGGSDLACLHLLIGHDDSWGLAPLARAFVVALPTATTATTSAATAAGASSAGTEKSSSSEIVTSCLSSSSLTSTKEQTAGQLAARYGKGVDPRKMAAALAADVRAMLRAARASSLGGGSSGQESLADLWTAADRISPVFER